jgi:hypothetical protein
MRKYSELTKDYVEKFKPLVEKMTGINLQDIVVEEELENHRGAMRTHWEGPSIRVSETFLKGVEEEEKKKGRNDHELDLYMDYFVRKGTLHDLSHFVHDRLLQKRNYTFNEKLHDKTILPYTDNISFCEGFAMYMCLDYLKDLYEPKFAQLLEEDRQDYMPADMMQREIEQACNPYVRGYIFFKAIAETLGEEKLFEVATVPTEDPLEETRISHYLFRFLSKSNPEAYIKNFNEKYSKIYKGD